MKSQTIALKVALGLGRGADRVLTCDLTKEYVAINGDYRSCTGPGSSLLPPAPSSMPTAACCSPSGPPARRWRACGNFPAARSKPGERPEQTLIRELKEELGIVVREPCLAPLTFASHAYPDFHLLMPLYVCRRWEGMVTAMEGQRLAWVRPNRLRDYPMPPADEPLVAHLMTLL